MGQARAVGRVGLVQVEREERRAAAVADEHHAVEAVAHGRDRGPQRQQPLAEQRRDADPRAGRCSTSPPASPRSATATTASCSSATAAARRSSPSTSTRRSRPTASGSPHTAAGDPFDLNRFDLPGADAMVYLAGHRGRGPLPAARDRPVGRRRGRPGRLRSRARPVRPRQRVRGAARRAALRDRVPRPVPRRATRAGRAHRRAAHAARGARAGPPAPRGPRDRATTGDRRVSIATDFMRVYRTDADPVPSTCPSIRRTRDYGSIWGTPARLDQLRRGRLRAGREPGGVALDVVRALVAGRDRDHRQPDDAAGAAGRLHRRPLHLPVRRRPHRGVARHRAARPGHGGRPTTTASRPTAGREVATRHRRRLDHRVRVVPRRTSDHSSAPSTRAAAPGRASAVGQP